MTSDIKVSVCVITYNQENYIRDCLASLADQNVNFSFEVIVGEDCSTDKTREIVNEFVGRFPHIFRLITSDKNVGGRKNFNRVIDNAKGEFISVCEGDDYFIDRLKLQKSYDYMEKNPNTAMMFTPALQIQDGGGASKSIRNRYTENKISKIDLNWVLKKGGGFYPTATSFFRSSIFQNRPEWFDLHCTGDYPMAVLAILNGRIGYLDDITACYRINSGSMSNPVFDNRLSAKLKYMDNRKRNMRFFEALYCASILSDKMFSYLCAKEDYIYYAKLLSSGYPLSSLIGVFKIRKSIYFKFRLCLKAIATCVGHR